LATTYFSHCSADPQTVRSRTFPLGNHQATSSVEDSGRLQLALNTLGHPDLTAALIHHQSSGLRLSLQRVGYHFGYHVLSVLEPFLAARAACRMGSNVGCLPLHRASHPRYVRLGPRFVVRQYWWFRSRARAGGYGAFATPLRRVQGTALKVPRGSLLLEPDFNSRWELRRCDDNTT
jgi:hypothetical protein